MSEELPEHTIDVTQVIAKPEPAPDHPEMQTDNGSGIIQNGDWDQEPIHSLSMRMSGIFSLSWKKAASVTVF